MEYWDPPPSQGPHWLPQGHNSEYGSSLAGVTALWSLTDLEQDTFILA